MKGELDKNRIYPAFVIKQNSCRCSVCATHHEMQLSLPTPLWAIFYYYFIQINKNAT